MAKQQSNTTAPTEKKLFSVNIPHRYKTAGGEEKTKFREISVGFGNRQGGLSFTLPKGVTISSDTDIVIFPIDPQAAD